MVASVSGWARTHDKSTAARLGMRMPNDPRRMRLYEEAYLFDPPSHCQLKQRKKLGSHAFGSRKRAVIYAKIFTKTPKCVITSNNLLN